MKLAPHKEPTIPLSKFLVIMHMSLGVSEVHIIIASETPAASPIQVSQERERELEQGQYETAVPQLHYCA